MYPANQYMDPYHSRYRNHNPYPYYPPPGWEIPTGHPRAMDSPYRPPTYGPWPCNAGMHHPHPSEFHCCCNHTYPPDYYSFKPPLPHELPPPHLYYHGPFPQHSNAFPSYFFPPRPYPVDQMPYGYDKLKSHCCGCPNHVCHGEEKGNVKIEEERPDLKLESEHKDADSCSIIRHPNNQFPFIWLPPGSIEGKENGKRYELSPHLLNGWVPMSRKMTGDVKQQEEGNQLNGWAPVSSKRTGDVRHQEQDLEKKQFHWPMVWMPAEYDEPKKQAKDMKMEEAPNNSAEAPQSPKIKIIPLSWFDDGNHDQKPDNKDGSGDHSDRTVKSRPAISEYQDGMTLEGSPKATPAVPKTVNVERKPTRENYKTVPIVPENKIDENKASTYRTIPVMKESDEKNTSMSGKKEENKVSNVDKVEGNGKTKHSESSTAKHSKLPPVCLRVDPFPRKKSGNGSRSPSPPTRKDGDKAKKDVKEAQGQKLEPKQSDARHIAVSDVKEKSDVKEAQGQKLEPKQSDARHIAVSDVKEKSPNEMKKGMGLSNETVQASSLEHSWEEEVSTGKQDRKAQTRSTTIGTQENSSAERVKGCDENKNEDVSVVESEAAKVDARTRRANLSEPDAAVRIQSAYRGYDVRRWQPLDKLRKIRNVNEQMQGVKEQLKCIEDSFKKPTEKEQVAIGETIMNLLLKLDTIQGLHPSVRDARKSVARELVCLQEKLDTLCKQPLGESDHTNSNDKSEGVENISQTVAPTISTEACDKEERAVDLGKVEGPSSVDLVEPSDAVPSQIPMEVKQDADASEHKNEKEESYSTRIEEEKKGKAPGQFELQGPLDMVSDLPEHPTGIHEHKIEESNAVSVEQVTEKPAVEGEGKEVLVMNSTELSHDAASAGDSNGLKQCTASTEQTLHSESNTGQSSAFTKDINASAAAASVDSGVATEKDGPVEGQMHGTAEDQQKELHGPVVHLEDSSLSLQGEEQRDLIPADGSMSNTKDQSEEARDISMQDQAVDTMQDSRVKEPDGTPEASMNNVVLSPSAEPDSASEQTVVDESNHLVQCVVPGKDEQPREGQKTETTVDMLTGGSASDGALEALKKEYDTQESQSNLEEETNNTRDEIVLPELDSCELSCAHEGRTTGHERSEMEVSLESQTDTQEEHAAVALPDTGRCIDMLEEPWVDADTQEEHADVVLPETGECTETLKEVPVDTDTFEEHADVVLPETGECIETLKEASAANSAEDIGVQVSVTEECTEMPENPAGDVGVQASMTEKCTEVPEDAQMGVSGANSAYDADVQVSATENPTKDAPVRLAGVNPSEEEVHNMKEDISMQRENQASETALSANGRPDDDPQNDDKKKLAEENQQLKELLQKLLVSGNDQMGVITDLRDKVKALERKLARKKRPKVRVHRPARNATARVH